MQSKTSETEERGELVAILVGAAVAFGLGIYATLGADKAAEFFAGYLLEQSLSVDNLFVFVLIFDYFKVDQQGQDKVRHCAVSVWQKCGSQLSSMAEGCYWAASAGAVRTYTLQSCTCAVSTSFARTWIIVLL